MPYNAAQCRLFAAKEKRGEKVPKDWRRHCRGKKQGGIVAKQMKKGG